MEAVIDSTALIFGLKVPDLLVLLREEFSPVFVPEAVYTEVVVQGRKKGAVEVQGVEKHFEEKWLQSAHAKPLVVGSLGLGESEALALAQLKKIVCISDDRKAYQVGSALGIRVVSLPALLISWVKNKKVTKQKALALIDSMVQNGYYLKPVDYLAVKNALGA